MDEQRFFAALYRRRHTWVTYALVAACVAMFAVLQWRAGLVWDMPGGLLIDAGALYGLRVQQGEWWRLASAWFLHGSLLHLGLNMLALWQAGALLERAQGPGRMLLLYAGAGLVGSLASMWWKAHALSVGASGAIFGIYGALLVWLLDNRREIPLAVFRPLRSGVMAFIGYSLFAGAALPGIDNAAHVGGLAGGVLLGLALPAPLFATRPALWRSLRFWAGALAACALAAALGLGAEKSTTTLRQRAEFSQVMQSLALHDTLLNQQTQELFEALRARSISPQDAARKLDDELLPAWQLLINRLASEEVAPEDKSRHQAVLHYAQLRALALQNFGEALRTGNPAWLRRAEQLAHEAQAALMSAHASTPAPR